MSECRHICCWDLMLVWGWKNGKCVEEHGWCQKQAKNKTNFQGFSNELWYLFAAFLYSDNQNMIINAFTVLSSMCAPLCWWPVNKASCAVNSSQCPDVLGWEEKLWARQAPEMHLESRMLQTEAGLWALELQVPSFNSFSSCPSLEVGSVLQLNKKAFKDYPLLSSSLVGI